MPRIVFSDEEYQQLVRFAAERGLNPKEAVLAMAKLGNRATANPRVLLHSAPLEKETGKVFSTESQEVKPS
jgi:hypothetical protein